MKRDPKVNGSLPQLAERVTELEGRMFNFSCRLATVEVEPQGTDLYLLVFCFFAGIVIGRQIQQLFEPEAKRK